jgi:hypothetical protein
MIGKMGYKTFLWKHFLRANHSSVWVLQLVPSTFLSKNNLSKAIAVALRTC